MIGTDSDFLTDGSVSPVYPPFLLEKLTQDIFWWLKTLEEDQQRRWQDDWGYVAEAYVIRILARRAAAADCSFRPRLDTAEGEIDAILWMKGHVAVFEVTSSSLRDSESTALSWEALRDGVHRAFIERPSGGRPAYREALLQLLRDIRLILNGSFAEQVPVANLQRVYPVLVCTDRRARTPGIGPFLQKALMDRLEPAERQRVAGLAVWGIEDLEAAESLLENRHELQSATPRGLLKILRRWDVDRGPAPSWWQFADWAFGAGAPNAELEVEFNEFRASLPNYFVPESLEPSPAATDTQVRNSS